MTDKKILQKAIEKANINGWSPKDKSDKLYAASEHLCQMAIKLGLHIKIIFSHDFAEYFWKDNVIALDINTTIVQYVQQEKIKNWEYHLMMMVREKNPISYLKEYL